MNLSRLRSMYFVTVVVMALVILGLAAMVIDQSARIHRLSETVESMRLSVKIDEMIQDNEVTEESPAVQLRAALALGKQDLALEIFASEFAADMGSMQVVQSGDYAIALGDGMDNKTMDGCVESMTCFVVEMYKNKTTGIYLLKNQASQLSAIQLSDQSYEPKSSFVYTVSGPLNFGTSEVFEKDYRYFMQVDEEAYIETRTVKN